MGEFWLGVGALCAAFTLVGAMLGFFLRHVRLMVRAELVDFLKALNGTYVRAELFHETRTEADRRFLALERRRAS